MSGMAPLDFLFYLLAQVLTFTKRHYPHCYGRWPTLLCLLAVFFHRHWGVPVVMVPGPLPSPQQACLPYASVLAHLQPPIPASLGTKKPPFVLSPLPNARCLLPPAPTQTYLTPSPPVPPMYDTHSPSQKPLPRQLDLPPGLPGRPPAFADAHHAALAQLDLVLDGGEGARAVVREMDARERRRAEVVGTVRCFIFYFFLVKELAALALPLGKGGRGVEKGREERKGGGIYRSRTFPGTRRSRKRRFALADGAAAGGGRLGTSARRIGTGRMRGGGGGGGGGR